MGVLGNNKLVCGGVVGLWDGVVWCRIYIPLMLWDGEESG